MRKRSQQYEPEQIDQDQADYDNIAHQIEVKTMTTLNIGDTLPNGATLLAEHNGVVLAQVKPSEWATWQHNGDYGTYWGHYTCNIVEAMTDYAERAGI